MAILGSLLQKQSRNQDMRNHGHFRLPDLPRPPEWDLLAAECRGMHSSVGHVGRGVSSCACELGYLEVLGVMSISKLYLITSEVRARRAFAVASTVLVGALLVFPTPTAVAKTFAQPSPVMEAKCLMRQQTRVSGHSITKTPSRSEGCWTMLKTRGSVTHGKASMQ